LFWRILGTKISGNFGTAWAVGGFSSFWTGILGGHMFATRVHHSPKLKSSPIYFLFSLNSTNATFPSSPYVIEL